jgi:tRNA(Ile)-lysidine synthase
LSPAAAAGAKLRTVAVAYSGGRDSTALLHAMASIAAAMAGDAPNTPNMLINQGLRVLALHVHHGLSPHADDWWAHCQAQCQRWASAGLPVEFIGHRLNQPAAPGESIEAWARQARYQALRHMALGQCAGVVLLAHHRRDQAETVLLQALRGAGTAGLSGMPRCIERGGVTWARPWLHRPREAIEAYVQRYGLSHIEDDSNQNPRFARNRLRLQVWPAFTQAFPQAECALTDAADYAQQAHAALQELAIIDLAPLSTVRGLHIKPWSALSVARRSNALRVWLKSQHGQAVPASLVARLLVELLPGRSAGNSAKSSTKSAVEARSACWPLGASELRLYRGVLSYNLSATAALLQAGSAAPPTASPTASASEISPVEMRLSVLHPGHYPLPGWMGTLQVTQAADGETGVPLAWLAHLELRARVGGEKFQSALNRPARSLKKQYQDAGIPSWHRAGPLIYSGGQLVFVPTLGLDARVLGLPNQVVMRLNFVPWSTKNAPNQLQKITTK